MLKPRLHGLTITPFLTYESVLECITRYFGRIKLREVKASWVYNQGRGVTCICRDMGKCHYFGYLFWVAPGFLGTFLGYSLIFGYYFLAIPGI